MSFFVSDITRDKLVLLYFFNAADYEFTGDQIARIAIENDWCGYFELQQSLSELAQSGLLAMVKRPQGECYGISEAGRHTLAEFSARLPQSLRDSVDDYIRQNRQTLVRKSQHAASFTRIGPSEYIVKLKIIEGSLVLMSLTVNVVSREIAQKICDNWESRAQDVFTQTLSTLAAD